jgi:hypothetical protein
MLAIERRGFAANLGAGRKAPCRVATTGPITLVGEQTIDGVAVVADERVLVKDQANTSQNAAYICKTGDWELASDFNQRGDVVKGSFVFVTDGTTNGQTEWYVSTSGRPWPGREAIAFSQYITATAASRYAVTTGSQAYTLVPSDSSSSVKTVNTAAIQAAIDYAYANNLQTINIPAGTFYCDPDIYLDPPGNMRSSFGNPAVWQFTLHLKGAGGAGSVENQATILRFTETPTNGLLLVGPGHGMRVSDLNLFAPDPASRAAIATGYVGIGIAGATGGAHKTLIENVTVWNCRRAFVTGVNGVDVLADSNTFFKCAASNCYTGWHFAKSQNFINSLYDCVSSSKIAILADQGTPVNVIGGNLSLPNALAKAFAISGTSALSATTDSTLGSSHLNYTFTTTIAAGNAALAAGDYDVFTVLTEHFGLVPLQVADYNSGTGVGTFRFYQPWLASHFNMSGDIDADTDLEAEIQAATTLYAAEQVVTFRGCAVHMTGVHLENQGSVTLLYDHQVGFAGGVQSKIDSLHCNYNVDHGQLYSSTDDHKAVFYGQQVFPFIRHLTPDAASLELSNSWIPGYALGTDGIVIEVSGADRQLVVRNTRMRMPNIYVPLIQSYFDGTAASQTRGRGVWDQTPFLPGAEIENSEGAGMAVYLRHRRSALPFLGFMPAPWARPRIRRETITSIEAGPGSIGTYPPLHGGTFYEVDDDLVLGGPSPTALVASDHTAWSYGQNLTIDWEYKGHTHVVYLDDTSRMFPGLKIVLDNGSDGDQSYIVTGVYPTLGYITVLELTGNNNKYLYGTQTSIYTGATVEQEAYAFRRSGTMPASKFTTNSTVGVTTAAQGDLTGADFVNLKLSAVGSTNYTTRTAAQMFGDIPGCYSGYKYMLAVSNTSTGNTVLAGGSNVTVNSTGNIPASSVRMFEARFTSTAAVTIDGQLST